MRFYTDSIALVVFFVAALQGAVTGRDDASYAGWMCAAVWVVIAMARDEE